MKFSSSGNNRRTLRKSGRKSVLTRTEACELRSLLSASVISVDAVDSVDLPMDGGEDASAIVDATEVGSLPGAPIDTALTETQPGELGYDGLIFYSGVTEGERLLVDDEVSFEDAPTTEDWDPSWAHYNWYLDTDGSVQLVDATEVGSLPGAPIDTDLTETQPGDESADGEKAAIDESVIFEDTPPIEGWDPSWLYRSFASVAGDGSEEIIVDQGTGWEDGLDLGVSLDGFVPGDLTPNDLDGDGVPDDFVMYAFDPLPLEDGSGEPVDVIYFGGLNLEPVDGEVAVEVDKPASDQNDEIDYTFDPLTFDDAAGEPVDVVEDVELVPIQTLESSDYDPAVIFYSAAGGGELQRTNDNGSVQEETAAASTVAIPVRPSASNSLFNADSGRSSVGVPVGVQSTSALGSNSSPTKRNATQRRSSTQFTATRQSSESEGLNNLTPLLGGEASQGDNDSRENAVGPQDVESGSRETKVAGTEGNKGGRETKVAGGKQRWQEGNKGGRNR